MRSITRDEFIAAAISALDGARAGAQDGSRAGARVAIPVAVRILADQLTPVLAYRRLVREDDRAAPSFLLESVVNGERQGRYSIIGASPALTVLAAGTRPPEIGPPGRPGQPGRVGGASGSPWASLAAASVVGEHGHDPMAVLRAITRGVRLVRPTVSQDRRMLPACVLGGWFGYAGYDSVRYAEPHKLPWDGAPRADHDLPDVHFGLYDGVVAFDHTEQTVYAVKLGLVGPSGPGTAAEAGAAFDAAAAGVDAIARTLTARVDWALASGVLPPHPPAAAMSGHMDRAGFTEMVRRAKGYIKAGDIFQVVLAQRFERRSRVDPFEVYRALRAVNPSPYMVYMQAPPSILVAASPEILCRVHHDAGGDSIVTNRPLAGTRPRGRSAEQDTALEAQLLADGKEVAEHAMLVDLARNDVGVVARAGSIELGPVMAVERYSHVMHISSTVRGALREGLDAWDALRAALPVGTISGAPKIRAMQIIDELEPVRRGPYGGGIGYVGLDGQMDIALALRTIVVPPGRAGGGIGPGPDGLWTYHAQAGAGIVAESDPEAEYDETVAKAGALRRAIEVAEGAFLEAESSAGR